MNGTKNYLQVFDRPAHSFDLSEEQEQLLPNDQDIEFFREHGWFVTQKVLSDELIDRIFVATEELYAGNKDAEIPIPGCSNWKYGDDTPVRNNEYISFQKKAFWQISLSPVIGAIAGKLMNTDTVRYFQDQLVSKEPSVNHHETRSTNVGWHTDRSYHSNCTSDKILTAWIPLHDVDCSHGSLVMVDGSHKWSQTDHIRGFNHENHAEIEQDFLRQGKQFQKVPLVLKKGQISFHNSSIIHGSFQNRSKIMRRALVLNLQDGDNRHQPYWNNGKQINHFLDSFCRQQANGLPDYTDPAIFPVVWSKNVPCKNKKLPISL
ncbi:MAG: phytanoyl-CoA dioxygenase family protein [Cyanobacteria bacterium J06600_6]